ncbi:unnamed protein product, partial [Rotaria sp. Silwood1]
RIQQAEITSYITRSGLIIDDRCIITAAHRFNLLIEEEDVLVPWKRNNHLGMDSIGLQPNDIYWDDDRDVTVLKICRFEPIKDMSMLANK